MADDKLIFPIGFDLEEGVAKVEKDWGKMQKRLQDTFKSQTIQVDADISKAVLDKLYAKFEGLIKTMESKAPQIKLKMPDTVDFEQEINRLKVQLKSINLGELTDAESKDLYLYIRQLEALAKALKEVNKQEQLRQANNPANKALQEARAQEKLTRAKANDALAEQRRAKIATETARQSEINNRSAQRGAVIAEQKRAATARAEQAELRLTQAKERSTAATERQNVAYKTQSTYLARLAQRMIAYASVSQVLQFLRNVREVTAQFELQRVALGSIIGDLNETNAMFEQIKAAAVKSPFQIKELVTYTKQLAAYKIETDELFETTQRLADISAGLGVGMERLVLAYGQIRATGHLRASEVRQLTESGIPIVEELAKKMSQLRGETVSAAEVMGMISERAISFGMVKEVFDDMTSAGGMFYKMQEKQAETLAGQWSNLQDSISIMYEEIGNTERVNNAMKGMIGLIKSLAENWRIVGDVAMWSVGAAMGYAKVIKPISELIQKQRLLNKAKEMEMRVEKDLERIRNLNAKKELFADDAEYIQWADEEIKRLQEYADKHTKIAAEARKSAASLKGFGGALKSIGSFIKANWVGMLITAVTALVSWLISARQEANRLNKELAKIGTEGALQADQSVRNFERLAIAIRESADGSAKQTEALEEMKRAYGEFLPSQDKSIINLVREKDGYNAVTQAIREKIALQIQEQKLNTIASEYGSRIAKKETKLKDWLTGEDWRSVDKFSQEEATRITNAIRQAVSDGLISAGLDWEENAHTISKIIREQTGQWGNIDVMHGIEREKYEDFINILYEMNDQVQQVEWSMESATGSLGKYTQAYKNFKEELKDVTGTGEKFSFEWNESKTKAEIKAYNEFIGDLLAKEGIKFDIGEAIDFKGLYEALGDNYPQLKQVVAKIQGEYEKLVPKDLEKLIKEQFSTLATKYGASLDKLQHYFKSADQSTQDWVKTLKDAKTEIGNQIFDAKKLDKDTTALEAQKQVIEAMITAWDNSEKTKKASEKSAEQALKDELTAVEKIYKRYQDLRKLKSETDTQSILAEEFKGVSLTTLSKAYSPEQMIAVYQKALAEAQRLGKKDLVLEIQTKIGEFNVDEEQRELEKKLKDLSDNLSRTKTAKEFFDRMLGMTGDKQLSATLTLSVYGTTGDDLKSALVKQVQGAFAGQDLSKAINTDLNSIDLSALREIYNNLPEDFQEKQKQSMKQVLDMLENGQKDLASNFAKLLMDYDEMEQKRVTITQKATQEIATLEQGLQAQIEGIRQNKEITDKDSAIADATARAEAVRKAILAREKLELSKLSPEYIRFFSSINAMAMETANSTRTKLRRALFDAFEQGGISAEELRKELKAIDTQFNKLNENATLFSSYATGGFDAWLQKLQQSADELDAIAARMMKLESLDQMDEGDKNFVNKMLNIFGGKGQKSLSDLATSFNGDMSQMGDAVQKVGGQMQGMFSSAMGAISIVDAIIKGVGQPIDGVGQVIDQINSMRSEDNQIGGWFKYIQDFNKYAQAGWEDLKSGNIAGALANTVSSIISIFQNIQADKIKKLDDEIERQQELLDNLAYSYERLGKAQEKAFGSEYISNYQQRMENLQAQQEAYLKQANAERSKGKKADEDKIKEYEEAYREATDNIKDMQGELSEYFLGTDLPSAARDFANAWIDAYKEFGNTTDAMKEKFQDMIQNMVVESFAAKVIQSALQPIFDDIDRMAKDGVLDMSEAAKIADMTEVAVGNIDVGMTNLMNALSQAGISVRGMGSDLTGISRDIATASEESILGLAAGINTQNFYISQVPTKLDTIIGLLRGENLTQGSAITLQDLVTLQNQHLSHLPSIAQHTAETVAECKQIVAETRRTADALERVIKPKGTQSTYTMNTTLGS